MIQTEHGHEIVEHVERYVAMPLDVAGKLGEVDTDAKQVKENRKFGPRGNLSTQPLLEPPGVATDALTLIDEDGTARKAEDIFGEALANERRPGEAVLRRKIPGKHGHGPVARN